MHTKIPLVVILGGLAAFGGLWAVLATAGDGTGKFWEWQSTSWQSVSVGITGWMLAIFASLTWSSMRTQEKTRHREQFVLRRNELVTQTLRVRDLAYEYLSSLKSHKFQLDNATPSSEFLQTVSKVKNRLDNEIAEMTEKSTRFDDDFVKNRALNPDDVTAQDEDRVSSDITILSALEAGLIARKRSQEELVEVMKDIWLVPPPDSC